MNIDKLINEIEKPVQIKDVLFQTLNVGDNVLYAPKTATSTGLRQGIILNINYETKQIILDTCKIEVDPKDIVKITELLKLNGYSNPEFNSTLSKNKNNVYLFYCILPEENTDKILFLKPEYSGQAGLYMEYLKLMKKYSNLIIIPYTKYPIFEHIYPSKYKTSLFDSQPTIIDYVGLKSDLESESLDGYFTDYLKKLDYKTDIKSFNYSLNVLYSFKYDKFKKNEKNIPLNTLLDFTFNTETECSNIFNKPEFELTIDIPNSVSQVFSNEFYKISIYSLYKSFSIFWKVFITTNKKYDEWIQKNKDNIISIESMWELAQVQTQHKYLKTLASCTFQEKYFKNNIF